MVQYEKPSILVVDDDITNVMLLESVLKREGYRTLRALNGEQAVREAKSSLPDLILLDIMMPEVDGFSACKRLQQDSATTDIPVIFLSALEDVDSKVAAFDIGAVDYVAKPFQKQEVLARVRLHLKLNMAKRAVIAMQTEKFKQLHDAQLALLVSPEDMPGAKFGVSYSPLHEVGGDFYDVLDISDNVFGYFVADVSGHDLEASFTTPAIKALMAQQATVLYTPVETMKNVNSVLNTMMSNGNHMTASYVHLNRHAGQLEIVSAGHPPVLYVAENGDMEYFDSTGDVLGVFDSVCFAPAKHAVSEGDRFFIYSDGLIESFQRGCKTRQQGRQQLSEAVMRSQHLPIAQAVDHVFNDVLSGEAAMEDDIVLLGVEV
jgi:phosphoserine phosphatase RsbU/P